jgi:hypothetical protein
MIRKILALALVFSLCTAVLAKSSEKSDGGASTQSFEVNR